MKNFQIVLLQSHLGIRLNSTPPPPGEFMMTSHFLPWRRAKLSLSLHIPVSSWVPMNIPQYLEVPFSIRMAKYWEDHFMLALECTIWSLGFRSTGTSICAISQFHRLWGAAADARNGPCTPHLCKAALALLILATGSKVFIWSTASKTGGWITHCAFLSPLWGQGSSCPFRFSALLVIFVTVSKR